jgi:hypothetical protein
MSGFPKRSLSLWFPHQNRVYASLLLHTCYVPRPSHSSWFYHSNNTEWGMQIIKLFIILLLTRWWLFIHTRLHVSTVKCSSWDLKNVQKCKLGFHYVTDLHFASQWLWLLF